MKLNKKHFLLFQNKYLNHFNLMLFLMLGKYGLFILFWKGIALEFLNI